MWKEEIWIALRLSRGLTLRECKLRVWKRLNLIVNRTTGYSPYELFFNGSIQINEEINLEKSERNYANS